MRNLSQVVALLAVSGCMNNAARVERNSASHTSDNDATPLASAAPAEIHASPEVESSDAQVQGSTSVPKTPCDALKKDIRLPYFLKEKSALVVGLDQSCDSKKVSKVDAPQTKLSLLGVSCTGGPGLITRRGHSNQNWELVTFGMDLGCHMPSAEDVRAVGKKELGIEAEPHIISFVPMLIEYWEFERNNDAGFGSSPTLTGSGGGAEQWKKSETKSAGFPIKLYGRSSTIVKDQSVYEARAILMPKSNQRQFEVLVQEMKLLSPDDLKVTLDRCLAKTKARSDCADAFESQ